MIWDITKHIAKIEVETDFELEQHFCSCWGTERIHEQPSCKRYGELIVSEPKPVKLILHLTDGPRFLLECSEISFKDEARA